MSTNFNDIHKWQSMVKQVLGQDFFTDIFPNQMEMMNNNLAYNVYKSSSEIIVLVNIPYIRDISKIKLSLRDQELMIKGKINLGYEHLDVVESHIPHGEFEQTITLPDKVNSKRINAQYQRGILKIQLFPKMKREENIKIKDD